MVARKTKTFLADTPPEEVLSGVLVERPKKDALTRKAEQNEALAGIKNKIFGDSMKVVGDYMRARDVNPKCAATPTDDPEFWKMALENGGDDEETHKVYRLASAGWLPSADAPGFVKVAANMAIGIMKANAAEKGGSHVLNVGKILIDSSAIPQFEEREVE
jgi:hypothetical protein